MAFEKSVFIIKREACEILIKLKEDHYFSMLISLFGAFFNFENTRINSFPFQTNIMFLKFRTNLLPAPENSKGHLRIESHHNWHFPSFTLKKLMIQMYQDQLSVLIFSRDEKRNIWNPFYKVAYQMPTKLKRDSKNENMTQCDRRSYCVSHKLKQ